MDYLIIWSSLFVAFLILEMFTATFYGLSIALGSLAAALYVWIFDVNSLEAGQILVFGIVAVVFSIVFPRIFKRSDNPIKIGVESYVGKSTKLLQNDDTWKVKFDGVEYLVEADDTSTFEEGMKVKVVSVEGTTLVVNRT